MATITHKINSNSVQNVDYSVNREGQNIFTCAHNSGSITVELSDSALIEFKDKVVTVNEHLMLPTTTVNYSDIGEINNAKSFSIGYDELDGEVVVSYDANTNEPYLIIRTSEIEGYKRFIQIYLKSEHIDKLDTETIRNVSYVYPEAIIATANESDPEVIVTTTGGEFVTINVPTILRTTFKADMQTEADHLNDPLTVQTASGVSSKNVVSKTCESDEITAILIDHTTASNMSYLQIQSDEVTRNSLVTIYIDKDTFLALNTAVQIWV